MPHEADQGRLIAIGDIHGCSAALSTLVNTIQPQPSDTIIPLGDLIDYGPNSRGVIDQLLKLRDRTRLILLTGNHEAMLFGVLDDGRSLETWTACGGDRTLESYGIEHPRELPAAHVQLLRTVKPYHETDQFGFVHAGYAPNASLAETPFSTLHWDMLDTKRAWPHYSGRTFVVGHTPQESGDILDLGFLVDIDTDCSRGGWLASRRYVPWHLEVDWLSPGQSPRFRQAAMGPGSVHSRLSRNGIPTGKRLTADPRIGHLGCHRLATG